METLGFYFCAPSRIRTYDRLVKSELLYQLSYGCVFNFQLLYSNIRPNILSLPKQLWMPIIFNLLCNQSFLDTLSVPKQLWMHYKKVYTKNTKIKMVKLYNSARTFFERN